MRFAEPDSSALRPKMSGDERLPRACPPPSSQDSRVRQAAPLAESAIRGWSNSIAGRTANTFSGSAPSRVDVMAPASNRETSCALAFCTGIANTSARAAIAAFVSVIAATSLGSPATAVAQVQLPADGLPVVHDPGSHVPVGRALLPAEHLK